MQPHPRSLAAVALALAWAATAGPALAVSLGDMARDAAQDLQTVSPLIAWMFYLIGATIVGFALLKLKRHVDHPQQTSIGGGIMALLVGVALIAAPTLINAVSDTLGLTSGSPNVLRPRL